MADKGYYTHISHNTIILVEGEPQSALYQITSPS